MQVVHRPSPGDGPRMDPNDGGDPGTGRAPGGHVDRVGALVVLGSFVTMVGLIGDLLVHSLGTPTAGQTLFVVGITNPWSLVVFVGIVLTGIGGIVWASRLSSDYGALMGTALVLVLAFVMILGAWSGVRPRGQAAAAPAGGATLVGGSGGAPGGSTGAELQGIHDHASGPSEAGALTGAIAGEGTGAEGQARFGGHGHGEAGPTSDIEARQSIALLAQTKAATARFRSIAFAKAHGYRQVTQFIPTLGLHLANLKLLNKGFDPLRPPILLYQPEASGAMRLVGVAYSVPVSDTPPAGFPGGDDVWHYHTNLCFLASGDVTISPSKAACAARGGYFQARTAWLLHAWIWKANPKGVFTEGNPLIF